MKIQNVKEKRTFAINEGEYGAGVIGGQLVHALIKSGNDIKLYGYLFSSSHVVVAADLRGHGAKRYYRGYGR